MITTRTHLLALLALPTLLSVTTARADDLTAIPPADEETQALYADLHQGFLQWLASLPAENHPLLDETGEDCHRGQGGDVWFLGGTFGTVGTDEKQVGIVQRTCMIPDGKAIFFPIVNIFPNNIGEDPPFSDEELEFTAVVINALAARNVRLKLDGVEVPNVTETFLSEIPAFDLDFVEGGLLDIGDGGGTTRAAGAGYFVLLEPPSPGTHSLEFSGEYVFTEDVFGFEFEFELEVEYTLVIVPE